MGRSEAEAWRGQYTRTPSLRSTQCCHGFGGQLLGEVPRERCSPPLAALRGVDKVPPVRLTNYADTVEADILVKLNVYEPNAGTRAAFFCWMCIQNLQSVTPVLSRSSARRRHNAGGCCCCGGGGFFGVWLGGEHRGERDSGAGQQVADGLGEDG